MRRMILVLAVASMTAGYLLGTTPYSTCDCSFLTKLIMCQHFLL